MQETFVRAWEQLGSFRGQSALATWLHRVAVNTVLEQVRGARRDPARFDDKSEPGGHVAVRTFKGAIRLPPE